MFDRHAGTLTTPADSARQLTPSRWLFWADLARHSIFLRAIRGVIFLTKGNRGSCR